MPVTNDHTFGPIWQRSGGRANDALRADTLAWMPAEHRAAWERVRQGRLLYGGQHRQYFLDEGRSVFPYRPLHAGGPAFYVPYNLLGLISRKTADLLFGESPRVYTEDEVTQLRVDAIVERSWLSSVLLAAATDASWAGATCLEISVRGGEAFVGHVAPGEVYPLGVPGPDRQHDAYARYATAQVPAAEGTATDLLLLVTRYSAGRIDRTCFNLGGAGGGGAGMLAPGESVGLDRWPAKRDGQPLPEAEATGLSRPSLVWVPNEYDGASDYDGLIDAQDALNAKHTQVARVLVKHADPRIVAPAGAADEHGNVPADAEMLYEDADGVKWRYLTWDGQLPAAIEDRAFALSSLATQAEMPLSLLGVKDDATAESASKMRLNATNALAKAQRRAVVWRGAIVLALGLAHEAEVGRPPAAAIGVEMRDGLPDDEEARSNAIVNLRAAGAMSVERSLEQQWLDKPTVREELRRLDAEAAKATPSVLLGEPNQTNAAATGDDETDLTREAA